MPTARRWTVGGHLAHRFNPDLGVGRVVAVDHRTLVVEFPRAGTTLTLAASTDAVEPITLPVGRRVRLSLSGRESVVIEQLQDGRLVLESGELVSPVDVWPVDMERELLDRLAIGEFGDLEDLRARLGILHFVDVRKANGLGSFLGGRIRLFPHQLYVAERATKANPVRWLLADEVGLGKTIEAALILNRLVHIGRVRTCLIVAPESLTVQWLGELWRKYHQVFTLLDAARLGDVARDFGAGFNPFEVHPRAVIALETLVARPELTQQAAQAGIDLLIVDEAQRLRRPPGHPGDAHWRAVAPIADLGRHVLLLSATPLEDDAHGFFRLVQLLRPDALPSDVDINELREDHRGFPECTSSTRRVDIGGLPPRIGVPIDLQSSPAAAAIDEVIASIRSSAAANEVAKRQKLDRIRRALSSGAAFRGLLGPSEQALRKKALAMDSTDLRLAWLAPRAAEWRRRGEKTLIFVAYRETLELVREGLSQRTQVATAVFHEDLSTTRRDIEVARFREPEGPSVLVSTECGGEGRNFEFCQRIVLFDLPWNPAVVEQRIGRLDRIGRRLPVEIVYFRWPNGLGARVPRLLDDLGVFSAPLAGREPTLAGVEARIEAVALDPEAALDDAVRARILADIDADPGHLRRSAYEHLHREPYRAELAPSILARVPTTLDALAEGAILGACERLGLAVERGRGRHVFSIEIGGTSVVDSLPGVSGGSQFVGTFAREEAVERETLDFFASGHALVEGLVAHFEEAAIGRVACLRLELEGDEGDGLAAIYRDGPDTEIVAIDSTGRLRPEWSAALARWPLEAKRVEADGNRERWQRMVQRLSRHLDPRRPLHAALIVVVGTQKPQRWTQGPEATPGTSADRTVSGRLR